LKIRKNIIFIFITILTITSIVFAIPTSFYDRDIDYYMGDYSYFDGKRILCDSNYDDYGYCFDLVQTAWKVEVEIFDDSETCSYSRTFLNVSSGGHNVDVYDGEEHEFYIRAYFYSPVSGGCAGTWSAYPIHVEN